MIAIRRAEFPHYQPGFECMDVGISHHATGARDRKSCRPDVIARSPRRRHSRTQPADRRPRGLHRRGPTRCERLHARRPTTRLRLPTSSGVRPTPYPPNIGHATRLSSNAYPSGRRTRNRPTRHPRLQLHQRGDQDPHSHLPSDRSSSFRDGCHTVSFTRPPRRPRSRAQPHGTAVWVAPYDAQRHVPGSVRRPTNKCSGVNYRVSSHKPDGLVYDLSPSDRISR